MIYYHHDNPKIMIFNDFSKGQLGTKKILFFFFFIDVIPLFPKPWRHSHVKTENKMTSYDCAGVCVWVLHVVQLWTVDGLVLRDETAYSSIRKRTYHLEKRTMI